MVRPQQRPPRLSKFAIGAGVSSSIQASMLGLIFFRDLVLTRGVGKKVKCDGQQPASPSLMDCGIMSIG